MEMRAYQMVRITKWCPFRGKKGQIVPPLPKNPDGEYKIQFPDSPNTFSFKREDFVILKPTATRIR